MSERGDLVLLPYPFTDLSSAKRRPVLALTKPDSYGDFIALPITTRPQRDNGLPLTAGDLTDGRLPASSWIRTDRVVALNSRLIVKQFGRAADRVVDAAVAKLCAHLGCPGIG